jgi:hypothetical protein
MVMLAIRMWGTMCIVNPIVIVFAITFVGECIVIGGWIAIWCFFTLDVAIW